MNKLDRLYRRKSKLEAEIAELESVLETNYSKFADLQCDRKRIALEQLEHEITDAEEDELFNS
jgi:hypothetical protein